MSVNMVILLGHVGQDPAMRYPEAGQTYAFFSLATNERAGATEITEWHNIVATGEMAQMVERYVRKGTRLYIEGHLRTRRYTDRMKIERTRTEIYVNRMEILGRAQ